MTEPPAPNDETVPLCVDLDGTLVRTDMLHEMLLLLARTAPLSLLSVPGWVAQGKAIAKRRIADRVEVDASTLPYRAEVLALIEEARELGRPVVLATASPEKVALAIGDHLGLFDTVLSSGDRTNLSAEAKAQALVDRYGEQGFDYVGNSRADLPIFARARRAILVSSHGGLRKAAGGKATEIRHIDDPLHGMRAWLKALRAHQWLKNLLIFLPLIAAHSLFQSHLLTQSLAAFFAFSLCASSVYILNDLLDLAADRVHRSKRRRPFASGAIPVAAGVVVVPLLLAGSLALALLLPPRFLAVLILYYCVTTAYSFRLKKQVIVDVMLLAGLYTLRVIAGAAATGIKPTFWLLALSMFTFLSLAMVKRHSELRGAENVGIKLVGRGYHHDDLPVILALGVSSGMVSVLIFALYTQVGLQPGMYPKPEWLWFAPMLMLYWKARLWMKAQRGEIDDDPVVFAARDWQSLTTAALMAVVFTLATLGWSPW